MVEFVNERREGERKTRLKSFNRIQSNFVWKQVNARMELRMRMQYLFRKFSIADVERNSVLIGKSVTLLRIGTLSQSYLEIIKVSS